MLDMKQFLADRKAALLSLDKKIIQQYMHKYDVRIPTVENTFWIAVHAARTGAKDLPMEARIFSKRWLIERGYRSMDDGDIPA